MNEFLFRVGEVEVGRILDSYLLGQTMQSWFPDFDREAVKPHHEWLCPTHYDPESGHFPMPVHSWLFRIGGKNVLIDTCLGNDKNRPGQLEMHLLANRYVERLERHGLTVEDIDYVLCTHLHLDHVGWNTRLVDGRWVPTFPRAQYVMSRTEYEAAKIEAAQSDTPEFIKQVFVDSIYPIVETNRARMVDGVHELLDGLLLTPCPGHSPGHLRIDLRSSGELGVFAGDMLHSPVQVPFWQWSSRVCWDPLMSAQARRGLLEYCASENALLIPGHFEAPHVGRIRANGETFEIIFGV